MFNRLVDVWRKFTNPTPLAPDAERVAAEFKKESKGAPRLVVFVEHSGGWGNVSTYAVLSQGGDAAFLEEWQAETRTYKIVQEKIRRPVPLQTLDALLERVREIGWPVAGKDYERADSGWTEVGIVADGLAHFMGLSGRPIPLDSEPQGQVVKAILECIKSVKESKKP